jgi:hypothetical protein
MFVILLPVALIAGSSSAHTIPNTSLIHSVAPRVAFGRAEALHKAPVINGTMQVLLE